MSIPPSSESEQTLYRPVDHVYRSLDQNSQTSHSIVKSRKIPLIPIRQSQSMVETTENDEGCGDDGDGDSKDEEKYDRQIEEDYILHVDGKKVSWSRSKSLQALPPPMGGIEEIMVMLKGKFDKIKEEIDTDLCIFAGDLVGILEETSESYPEWKENLEDLLIIARKCAKMTCDEFWLKCENIVQILDDRRQDLPTGTVKQVHTRLFFILTRCTRLVQFHKECGYEKDHHILGLHQLSDLGAYSEKVIEATYHDLNSSLEETEVVETHSEHTHIVDQEQDQSNINLDGGTDKMEVDTAKSIASSTGNLKHENS